LPVLASRIDGSVGLLGRDYPGYFPVGDERALARLLRRIEEDRDFARRLETGIARRRGLFTLAREHAAWKRLIEDMTRVRRG
jgi:glycosyltransferase involved in cell wall biosynthesis